MTEAKTGREEGKAREEKEQEK